MKSWIVLSRKGVPIAHIVIKTFDFSVISKLVVNYVLGAQSELFNSLRLG